MFPNSWSSSRTKSRDGTPTYPGLQGSIRSPDGVSGNDRNSVAGYSRQDHLDSYLKDAVLGKSTMKISPDDTTYDTVFSTVSEDTLILRVHFPAFAASIRSPEMKLTGVNATHPWIDGIGKIIGYAPISSDRAFRDSRISLGQAVKQVVEHLQLNPPTIVKFLDPQLASLQPKKKQQPTPQLATSNHASADTAPPSYETVLDGSDTRGVFVPSNFVEQKARSQNNSITVDLPQCPTEFPALDSMDRDELDKLLNNDVDFLAFCNNLPFTKELDGIVALKAEEAEKLAKENLSTQTELQELYKSTQVLHEKLKTMVDEFRTLERRQDALQEMPDQRTLIRELEKSKKEAFDESEKMAEAWLADAQRCAETMTDFCNAFLAKRKVHHLRASKIQIMRRQEPENGRNYLKKLSSAT